MSGAVVSLICAMDQNRGIGYRQNLPWARLSGDLKRFRALTLGKPIIMGRKTFESIGAPLPGRPNGVITRSPHFYASGCRLFSSLEGALQCYADAPEVMIIGGGELYSVALPLAHRLYFTFVQGVFPADIFFPSWDPALWREVACTRYPVDDHNAYSCTVKIFERKGC